MSKLQELNQKYTELCALLGEKRLFISLLEKEAKDMLDDLRNIKNQADKILAQKRAEQGITLPSQDQAAIDVKVEAEDGLAKSE